MPKINLRLSDEQHEALVKWARDGERSVQKELIFRLFSTRSGAGLSGVGETGSKRPDAEPPAPVQADTQADGRTKPGKRLHPCKHHVPPSRTCQYCDA